MTTQSEQNEVWYCPVCELVLKRPAGRDLSRCNGTEASGRWLEDYGSEHWPVEMTRVALRPAESPAEALERVRGYVDLSQALTRAPGGSQGDSGGTRLSAHGRRVEDLMSPADREAFGVEGAA